MFRTYTYTYDRDRATKVVQDQGISGEEMAWIYRYDAKGQVASADKRFHSGGGTLGNFLAGHQTDFTYDEAGNRLTKREGGDDTATEGTPTIPNGTRGHTYATNVLNQYTSIANPVSSGKQQFEVTGRRATSTTNIVITSPDSTPTSATAGYQSTSSGLHYWRRLDNTAPTTTPPGNFGSYEFVTVTADGSTTDGGSQFLPHPNETREYDADGNLRNDSRWKYEWDAENRLTVLTTRYAASSGAPGIRLNYGYDGLARRIWSSKSTSTDGTNWVIASLETFLYDGWNLVMRITIKIDSPNQGDATARQSYVWGPDNVSRPDGHSTWQDGGGTGGLLMVLDKNANAYSNTGDNFFPLMDRMGNVTGYRSSDSGSAPVLSAVYEYDAFGREMKSLGLTSAYSNANIGDILPFRFSTKFSDFDSGLTYYGYRYYDPVAGRWPSRDPIEEEGGSALYGMVGNDTVNHMDSLGLWKIERKQAATATATAEAGDTIQKLADIIGLSSADFKKWSTTNSKTSEVNSTVKVGCTWQIPNTIVAYWAGNDVFAGIGKGYVG